MLMMRGTFSSFSVPRGEELPGGELAVAGIDVGRFNRGNVETLKGLSSVLLRVGLGGMGGGEDWGKEGDESGW